MENSTVQYKSLFILCNALKEELKALKEWVMELCETQEKKHF